MYGIYFNNRRSNVEGALTNKYVTATSVKLLYGAVSVEEL